MFDKIELFCSDLDTEMIKWVGYDDYFGKESPEIQKKVIECIEKSLEFLQAELESELRQYT